MQCRALPSMSASIFSPYRALVAPVCHIALPLDFSALSRFLQHTYWPRLERRCVTSSRAFGFRLTSVISQSLSISIFSFSFLSFHCRYFSPLTHISLLLRSSASHVGALILQACLHH
ncbi:hypothetical protein SISNIDRAFT_174231 [Sistotremastrum niveocremeum HHB9708]|uniref:Uncharacterized protein n=1 Tax=Sistotremastrum niveocremeum HHB9708 TaxID=1314777 RepID=A0A164RWH6_9AGAM|nr:hypothetical protein SISNIDRAFT_174231 [Sistotremastrum niveocremeum HHB9708]